LAVGFFHFVKDFFANLVNACLAVPGYVDFSGYDFVADFEDSVLVQGECVVVEGERVSVVDGFYVFQFVDDVFWASCSVFFTEDSGCCAEGALEWASSARYNWQKEFAVKQVLL
jgi:hypothetical protein